MKNFTFSLLPNKKKIGYLIAKSYLYQPVFLVGCGRSGTTALGRALGQHPAIRAANSEGALINHIGGVAGHYCCHEVSDYMVNSTALTDDSLREQLIKLIYEVVWGANYGLRGVLSNYLRNLGKSTPSRWLVKAFPDEREYSGLTFLFSKAQFIYIYRNGIDVVNSMTKFGWFSKQPFEDLCKFWATHMERYSYLEDRKALVVRFEDFAEQPENVLSRTLDYLGLWQESSVVAYAKSNVIHPLDQPDMEASPKEMLNSRPEAYQGWTHEQKKSFKEICGDMMKKHGYEVPF